MGRRFRAKASVEAQLEFSGLAEHPQHFRNFWLEASELDFARESLLPRMENEIANMERSLRQVLELIAAGFIEDASMRRKCLERLARSHRRFTTSKGTRWRLRTS